MSQSTQPSASRPPTPRETMNFVGVLLLFALAMFGLLCVRFVGPNERAFVQGERVLGGLDDATVLKWPWETASYVELTTYSYREEHEAYLRDGRWISGAVRDYDVGARFEISFEYELIDVNDAAAQHLDVRDDGSGPLEHFFRERLWRGAALWYLDTLPEALVTSLVRDLPVKIRSFTIEKTQKVGTPKQRNRAERMTGAYLIAAMFADVPMPIKLSNIVRNRRSFLEVMERGASLPDAHLKYFKNVVAARSP